MPEPQLPRLKLPSLQLPDIRPMPTIPGVGCVPSDGHSYLGEQFGNVPDLQAVQQIRSLKKTFEEEIAALVEGYLPTAARQPLWAARVAQLTNYVAELNAVMTQAVGRATAEINATLAFVGQKQEEMQTALAEINSIPEAARTQTQRLMAERYQQYAGELEAQASRLQATAACVAG